jgi:hypothetical protein
MKKNPLKKRLLAHKGIVIGIILSIAWWVFLIIQQLKTDLVCDASDTLCNSGNTVLGDIAWASMIALPTLYIAWMLALCCHLIRKKFSRK